MICILFKCQPYIKIGSYDLYITLKYIIYVVSNFYTHYRITGIGIDRTLLIWCYLRCTACVIAICKLIICVHVVWWRIWINLNFHRFYSPLFHNNIWYEYNIIMYYVEINIYLCTLQIYIWIDIVWRFQSTIYYLILFIFIIILW